MTTTIRRLDLAPFGFTPTESLAYGALLDLGPSSGYAVAKTLSIARANAYQALHGLVAKGAANMSEGSPRLFRAVTPAALLALVSGRQARELDTLEEAVREARPRGADLTVQFRDERSFRELTLRTAARAREPVTCLAPAGLLVSLLPVWRKRQADGATTVLFCVGSPPRDFPVPLAAVLEPERVRQFFGTGAAIVLAGEAAIVARPEGETLTGFWCSPPVLVGMARAAVAALTSP